MKRLILVVLLCLFAFAAPAQTFHRVVAGSVQSWPSMHFTYNEAAASLYPSVVATIYTGRRDVPIIHIHRAFADLIWIHGPVIPNVERFEKRPRGEDALELALRYRAKKTRFPSTQAFLAESQEAWYVITMPTEGS